MANDDDAPSEAQQRRAAAWATIRDSQPMTVPEPAALMTELAGLRGRGLSDPESMHNLINQGRRD